jgi:hypothetical protein
LDRLSLVWLFFILASLQPAAERYLLEARRRSTLASLGALAPPTLDDALVATLSEVGIVLLLFMLGLEYSTLVCASVRECPLALS